MAERQAGSVLETRPRSEETVGLMRISDIRDVKVRNPEGEELGDLTDLAIDRESGRIAYAVLSYGGILGFGEKHFAIPWEAVHTHPGERVFVVDVDKRTLDGAPGFARDAMPREGDWNLIRTLPPPRGAAEPSPPGAERVLPPQPAVQTVAGGWGGQPTRQQAEERPVETKVRPRETIVEEVREEQTSTRAGPPPVHLGAADLQAYLKGMNYPAGKQDLIDHARERNAPEDIIVALEQFGERTYQSAADVSVEFGKIK